MSNTAARHADLRTDLIRLAQLQIAQQGMASLRARGLAAQAGCAVGALYNDLKRFAFNLSQIECKPRHVRPVNVAFCF